MIYIRLKPRVIAMAGQALTLGDVVDLMADARFQLHRMQVALPKSQGVWQVDALQLVVQIQEMYPSEDVRVLGDGMGWLHREVNQTQAISAKKKLGKKGRIAMACLLLAVGSMLLIGWISLYANSGDAQYAALRQVAGYPLGGPLLIAFLYVIGIFAGFTLYRAIKRRKLAALPPVKLRAYREDIARSVERHGNEP